MGYEENGSMEQARVSEYTLLAYNDSQFVCYLCSADGLYLAYFANKAIHRNMEKKSSDKF